MYGSIIWCYLKSLLLKSYDWTHTRQVTVSNNHTLEISNNKYLINILKLIKHLNATEKGSQRIV